MSQPGAIGAMWLIARLRLQRLWNMVAGFRLRRPGKTRSRPASPAKKRMGAVLAVVLGLGMMFTVLNIARQSVLNAQCYLEPSSRCMSADTDGDTRVDMGTASAELHGAPFHAPVAIALTMELSLLFLASILLPLSSREIAAADWDLEWLVTLPVERATLLWGRILERTLVNPTGWILLTPCCVMLAWYAGFGWGAPLAGIGAALLLLPLAAMVRTLADTGLRMSLAPSQLRNIQAITAIIGMPVMYLAFAFGTMHADSPVLSMARAFPRWSLWTPPGLLVRVIGAGSAAQAGALLALLLLEVALPVWAGMQLLRHQLRLGVVASGSRETARNAKRTPGAGAFAFLLPKSPIMRRELRLLSRDRNFLIQSLLMPLIIVGSQLLLSGSWTAFADIANRPTFVAAMAFGIGSYMLMLSAFQTLNNEGQSLWMLYTFPRSIESVLKEKARFWGALALLYPVLILAAALWLAPAKAATTLPLFVMVLAGIPVFSSIAVALGVFGCDPLAQDARSKVRPGYFYLYTTLAGLYGYAITTDQWLQKLVMLILTASLAAALWQKARDQLPYLLDSEVAPPARVSTADGLLAAMLFFVLQGAIFLFLAKARDMPAGEALVYAFGVAGLVVYATMRLVFWRSKTGAVPAMLAGHAGRALAWGAAGAGVASALGAAYLHAIRHWHLFSNAALAAGAPALDRHWLILLAVVAAPLCEEFIFRGLIFGGLRRSSGLLPSMLMSAALFAIVHPPVSMLPVFALGLCTAFVYERTRALLAPVLVHALYNAVVIALQLNP